MPQLISVNKKLFRLNLADNCLEYSVTNGATWVSLSRLGNGFGRVKDLLWFHNKLFLLTENGLWRSGSEGANWVRCGGGKIVESLVAIVDGGKFLYGLSSDGKMWFSNNEGACWGLRG